MPKADPRRIREIHEQCRGPFYLYDESVVGERLDALLRAFPSYEFLYSVKANPFPPLARFIFGRGAGADAASAAEVELAAGMGLAPGRILYSSPGKTRDDIERAHDKAVIVADSLNELRLLDRFADERGIRLSVGARINPDFTMTGDKGASGKFGIDEDAFLAAGNPLRTAKNLRFAGLHVHVRSQVLDESLLRAYYGRVFNLAAKCSEAFGHAPEFVNFGGGLGIPYSPVTDRALDIPALGAACERLRESHPGFSGVRLCVETGRFPTCDAGWYVTPVVDVKESRGVKYVVVRNGLNGFLRPVVSELIAAARHGDCAGFAAEPLFTVRDAFALSLNGKSGNEEKVTVVGNLCTAADVLASGIMLPRAEVGDLLVVSKAGSYAYPLSPTQFSSHAPPRQVYIAANGEWRIG